MNKTYSLLSRFINIVILLYVLLILSCNKKFDEPPIGADPEIEVNMTIQELKAGYAGMGIFQSIPDDKIISGIVTADDRSGNFYKQIVIQDETGGIPILLDGNSVYTSYPIGRRVFVKLKGMMLGDYGGTIQIGLDSSRSDDGRFLNLGRIPQAQFDQFIIKGSYGNKVIPKIVKPSDFTKKINDPLLSMLVQINSVEFRETDLAKNYADTTLAQSAINFTVRTCDNQSVILRNSSYARFAGIKVAEGNGPLQGIASIFNGTVQMNIRDTFDVQFKGTRCSGQAPTAVTKTIADVLKYATGDSSVPGGVWIEGVVISDTKNEATGNYRLQDATAGIQIRFASGNYPTTTLGDKLKVYIGGFKLSTFNGGLQISGVETSAASTATGTVTPRVATIANINSNMRAWESTLVTIKDVTISGSGTNYTIKDASGEISSFVRTAAGIVMPTAATGITGYISVYQPAGGAASPQLTLRTQADITGGTSGPPLLSAIFDFAGVTTSSGTTDPTAAPQIAGLNFSNFKAVGVGTNSSAGTRFSFTGWGIGATNGSDVFTGTIDLNKYYEISITPNSGSKLDLNKLTFTLQRSGTGVRQLAVRSSIDNFAGNLPASVNPDNATLSVVATNIFQITDAATTAQEGCTISFGEGFKNLTTPVTLRFYGFNAKAATGTFSIDNVKIDLTMQ